MSKRFSSRQVLAAQTRAGFRQVNQRGSHVKLRLDRGGQVFAVIAEDPAPEIPAGTFSSILRQAGLTRAEFEDLL